MAGESVQYLEMAAVAVEGSNYSISVCAIPERLPTD